MSAKLDDLSATRRAEILAARPAPAGLAEVVNVDGEIVYWPEGKSPGVVDRLTTALLPYFDGSNSVDELLEDLAASIQAPVDAVEAAVIDRLRHLAVDGIVDGLGEIAPGLEVRTEERLPDGRFLRTVTVTISTRDLGGDELMQSLLTEERSLAEIVPVDSCLGQKLRLGEPAQTVGVELGGRVVTIRCDHDETLAALAEHVRLVAPDGPTMAFVSAPLEGSGPPRVYDRTGSRAGRPRSGAEAARVVGHLLRELVAPEGSGGVVVSATPVVRDGRCVLIGPQLGTEPRLASLLDRGGARLLPSRRAVLRGDDGRVLIDQPFDAQLLDLALAGSVMFDEDPQLSARSQSITTLLSEARPFDGSARQQALWIVSDAITAVPSVAVDSTEDPSRSLATAILDLL